MVSHVLFTVESFLLFLLLAEHLSAQWLFRAHPTLGRILLNRKANRSEVRLGLLSLVRRLLLPWLINDGVFVITKQLVQSFLRPSLSSSTYLPRLWTTHCSPSNVRPGRLVGQRLVLIGHEHRGINVKFRATVVKLGFGGPALASLIVTTTPFLVAALVLFRI